MSWLRTRSCVGSVSMVVMFCLLPLARPSVGDEAKEITGPPTWYVSTVVSGRGGYRVTHYWSLGPTLRAETMLGVRPITTIVRGNRYLVFDELRGEGVEVKRSPLAIAEDATRGRPFGNDLERLIRASGERVEAGVLNGIPAEIWRVTNSTGRRTVWVAVGESEVPLRVENFDRESGDSATLNYSNWASGFEIPERFFEPVAGLQIQKLEYDEWVAESLKGPVRGLPILYPELIHGFRAN